MNKESLLLLLAIGLLTGTFSGLVGVGGGIILVPALVFFLGFTQQRAQGTSIGLLLLPVGILAAFNYYKEGLIDFKVIGILCCGFIIGGWFGSKLALSIPEDLIKKLFAIILFYTAIRIIGWDKIVYEWIVGIMKQH
jgi:uncharacterized membrane protein YfcA